MLSETAILDHLNTPQTFLSFKLLHELKQRLPDKAIFQTSSWAFQFEEFAGERNCEIEVVPNYFSQIPITWSRAGIVQEVENALWNIRWKDHEFQILRIQWAGGCGSVSIEYIIAEKEQIARDFFHTVCDWADQCEGIVKVFSNGYWERSSELFKSIENSSLESLILPVEKRQAIVSDFERFLECRENYEKYDISWKRGVLFIGPPGNGKTHFIRALINHLQIPCFYVKSFETRDDLECSGIQQVYETVRRTSPAILVLEDLDSLINEKNRSYFLNELDGFENNHGVITVATTNYPEKLDSAILDRPSRFDQKWFFGLPDTSERRLYLDRWNESLPEKAWLTDNQLNEIASATDDYSFAYLKELCLGGILKWVKSDEQTQLFEEIMKHRSLLAKQSELTCSADESP